MSFYLEKGDPACFGVGWKGWGWLGDTTAMISEANALSISAHFRLQLHQAFFECNRLRIYNNNKKKLKKIDVSQKKTSSLFLLSSRIGRSVFLIFFLFLKQLFRESASSPLICLIERVVLIFAPCMMQKLITI